MATRIATTPALAVSSKWLSLLVAAGVPVLVWSIVMAAGLPCAAQPEMIVEVEEDVTTYQPANNGAGPMWCYGNTCVVRSGEQIFVSSLETIPAAKPLNNCLPILFHRTDAGWQRLYEGTQRTREPSPLACLNDGRVLMSINPTLTPADTYGGPAEPRVLQWNAFEGAKQMQTLVPGWEGEPPFTEHSYRSFVADGPRGEWILFQNVGYTHSEWTFHNQQGQWAAQGKLQWPWGAEYDKPQPIRICYPLVALQDRAVHFCGVSDIVEPNLEWREYKRKLTGRQWDYDFRRLFYTWCDDITTGRFHPWVEISSREKTCGWISPADLYLAPEGRTFILWQERALDERLRADFFPEAKQRESLELAIVRDGKLVRRTILAESGEGLGGLRPGRGRFHVTPDGRLLVLYYVGGQDAAGAAVSANRLVEIDADGSPGPHRTVPLARPFLSFFTATTRAGCQPSFLIDLYGDNGGTMRYARIRLSDPSRGGANGR